MARVEALTRLNAFLSADSARTQQWLAGEIGVNQSTVSLLLRGKLRPTALLREKIQLVAGIPLDLWHTAKERRALEALRTRQVQSSPPADS